VGLRTYLATHPWLFKKGLRKVTHPASLEVIEKHAFHCCTSSSVMIRSCVAKVKEFIRRLSTTGGRVWSLRDRLKYCCLHIAYSTLCLAWDHHLDILWSWCNSVCIYMIWIWCSIRLDIRPQADAAPSEPILWISLRPNHNMISEKVKSARWERKSGN
jgi:hypothetical protein